jgi:hypothetical protein
LYAVAVEKLVVELQSRFPTHHLMDALGMVYPQYWTVPDAWENFGKHMEIIKSHYCEQKKTNVPKKAKKGKEKAKRSVEENDDVEDGGAPDFIDLTEKTAKTRRKASKMKAAKMKQKTMKNKEKTTSVVALQEGGAFEIAMTIAMEAETSARVQVPSAMQEHMTAEEVALAIDICGAFTNMDEKIVPQPQEMEEKIHDPLLSAHWLAEQSDLLMITMEFNAQKVLEGDVTTVNPLTTLWQLIDSNSMLWHNLSEFFKLAEITTVLVLDSVEDERTFSTLSFTKDKLCNRLHVHLPLVVVMHGQSFFDIKNFPYDAAYANLKLKTRLDHHY